MPEKYYLDACIWIDYFENRSDKFRPLGDWALRLINKIIEDESYFIFSDLLMNELRKQYSEDRLNYLLEIVPMRLKVIIAAKEKNSRDALYIQKDLGIPFSDSLHWVLAKDNGAIFVTRDRHFDKLGNKCEVKKPEDLI